MWIVFCVQLNMCEGVLYWTKILTVLSEIPCAQGELIPNVVIAASLYRLLGGVTRTRRPIMKKMNLTGGIARLVFCLFLRST